MSGYKLVACPLCGETGSLHKGKIKNIDSYWDSSMRGEFCGYVMCEKCNLILKAHDAQEAISKWNKRAVIDAKELEAQAERKRLKDRWEKICKKYKYVQHGRYEDGHFIPSYGEYPYADANERKS